jgi:4-alpha-glucanotransferase
MSELRTLAEAAGISTRWTHADGYEVVVEDGPLRRILTAMGFDCESDTQCRQSHANIDEELRRTALPPMLTGWCGERIPIDALSGLHGHTYELTVEGKTHSAQFSSDRLESLLLPPIAVPGYHTLEVDGRQVTLAIAPKRCFSLDDISEGERGAGRFWGLAVQLYSLRREGDAGIGDFTALRTLAESAGHLGASALAISPVHAMPGSGISSFSPYSPSSRLFLNALHIDPAAILEAERLDALVAEDLCATRLRCELEKSDMVDWPTASHWRINIMRKLFEAFKAEGGDQEAFAAFRREQGEALEDHARFEALRSYYATQGLETFWPRWPEQYRHPRRPEVAAFAQQHAAEVDFHAFLQWQAARGMDAAHQAARAAGMPIGLISDFAVGSDRGGSHAWSRQEEMLNGLSIGAPPDRFNTEGQDWGLVTLCPRAMRRNGYHAYIEMVRSALRHAGGVRIDHILGLARLWMVPPGLPPTCGAYLRYPMDDILRLLALESHRHRAIVIGENLGTIPEGFNEKITDAGVLGMQVLWFLRNGNEFLPPSDWTSDGIGMTTTHDLPTVAGWWDGCDIAWKSRLGLLDRRATLDSEIHQRACERRALRQALHTFKSSAKPEPGDSLGEAPVSDVLSFVGSTPAPLVIVPLEDALADSQQPNLPSTIDEHPNWRRRISLPVNRLLHEPDVARRLAALADSRQNGHREAS